MVRRTTTYVSVWLGWHLQGREQCSPYSQLSPVPLHARCSQAAPAHPSWQEQAPDSGSHEPPFRHEHSCAHSWPKVPSGHSSWHCGQG